MENDGKSVKTATSIHVNDVKTKKRWSEGEALINASDGWFFNLCESSLIY
jgi:hypothetical protein